MPSTLDTIPTGQDQVKKYTELIRGKVILTTGVSPGGLGAQFVDAVAAAQPALLILAGRSEINCQETAKSLAKDRAGVQTKILHLDLSSLAAVRRAADEVLSWTDVPVIDILVNNAGIMAAPFSLSVDGYESQFTSNHLGHFLFTNLIMPKLLAAPSPRVVSVSSSGHRFGGVRFSDVNFDVSYFFQLAYCMNSISNT